MKEEVYVRGGDGFWSKWAPALCCVIEEEEEIEFRIFIFFPKLHREIGQKTLHF